MPVPVWVVLINQFAAEFAYIPVKTLTRVKIAAFYLNCWILFWEDIDCRFFEIEENLFRSNSTRKLIHANNKLSIKVLSFFAK